MSPLLKILYIYLVVFVLIIPEIDCGHRRNEKEPDYENVTSKQNRGIGISAWGLVILILTLILLGVAAYYIALFYPLICKKERKYNRIELATV